jgi:hypothetical protein
MYHLYLVARRREPEAPRFAAEITLRARAAARDRERELLRAEPHEERVERPRLRPRLPRFVARARTRRARARALEI